MFTSKKSYSKVKYYLLAAILAIGTICMIYKSFSYYPLIDAQTLWENKDEICPENDTFSYMYQVPYISLNGGKYTISVAYQLSGANAQISIITNNRVICSGYLQPQQKVYNCKFFIANNSDLVIRVSTDSENQFSIKEIKLQRFLAKDIPYLLPLSFILFLLYFKLIVWIVRIKCLQQIENIELIFIICFFVILLLPVTHLSDKEYDLREKRKLAAYPELLSNGYFNGNYGLFVENWFNDRFTGRDILLKLYSDLRNFINKHPRNYGTYLGKNETLFRKDEFEPRKLSTTEISDIIANVSRFKTFCRNNNIACYIEIVPRRNKFFKGKGNKKIQDEIDTEYILAQQIKEKANFDIIYPLADMQIGDRYDLVYFKTDHHWSEWGAYIGYKALMNRIKQDFPNIYTVKETDFNIFYDHRIRYEYDRLFWQGTFCKDIYITLKECPLNTLYRYYQHKNSKNLHVTIDDELNKRYRYLKGNKLKAVVIGNSFTENLSSFMAYTFTDYIKFRTNNKNGDNLHFSRWSNFILEEKPDILAIVIEAEYVYHLADLYSG